MSKFKPGSPVKKNLFSLSQAVSYCIEALEDGDEDLRSGACFALQRVEVKTGHGEMLG